MHSMPNLSDKDKDQIISLILTKNWVDWIDYWAVDFDYASKKEIIRIGKNGDEPKMIMKD